jgi:hypothetical protein
MLLLAGCPADVLLAPTSTIPEKLIPACTALTMYFTVLQTRLPPTDERGWMYNAVAEYSGC